MRTIKFRGRTFKDDWVYGDLTNDGGGLSFNEASWIRRNITENRTEDTLTAYRSETTKRIHWKEGTCSCNAPVLPETVGQFTGLLDHNGKEIYEGDILKDGKCQFGQVLWAHNSWLIEWDERDYRGHRIYDKMIDDCFGFGEVIGNIHENPDLIK